jgi:hypothetical protein
MENKMWDNITNTFELDLPKRLETLEQYVEHIVPKVQPWSEDLWETQFYINKRWKEIRDTDTYHEVVLHIFMENGEYWVVIDGDITKGTWQIFKQTNSLVVDYGGKSQMFELTFLNDDFFILKKHGDQARKGKQKYYVYGNEKSTGKLDWRNAMEKLYNIYRENSKFSTWLVVVIVIIIAFLVFTFNF